ncbi:MAG: hypothetical protein ACO3PV_10290 [Pseudohongiellaceae bacterium]
MTVKKLLQLACILALCSPILHVALLVLEPDITYRDPVQRLSLGQWGFLHSAGIVLFGLAQLALAHAMRGLDRGWCWPLAQASVAAAGISLFYVAWYFAVSEAGSLTRVSTGESHDPLWLSASLVGTAMGLALPGFRRISSGLARFSGACLLAWLLLIPASLLTDTISLGVYERVVGSIYVLWVALVSYRL